MLVSLALSAPNGLVKMWEGVETLPTYRVNAPEKAPLFERDFAYQRSRSVTTIFGLIIIWILFAEFPDTWKSLQRINVIFYS